MRGQARLMENVFLVFLFIMLGSIFLILILASSVQSSAKQGVKERLDRTFQTGMHASKLGMLQCHVLTSVEPFCIDLLQADAFRSASEQDFSREAFFHLRKSKVVLSTFPFLSMQEKNGLDEVQYYGCGEPSDSACTPTRRTVYFSRDQMLVYNALPPPRDGRAGGMAFAYPIRAYDPVSDAYYPAVLSVVVGS